LITRRRRAEESLKWNLGMSYQTREKGPLTKEESATVSHHGINDKSQPDARSDCNSTFTEAS
jgi:hypothetical protein